MTAAAAVVAIGANFGLFGMAADTQPLDTIGVEGDPAPVDTTQPPTVETVVVDVPAPGSGGGSSNGFSGSTGGTSGVSNPGPGVGSSPGDTSGPSRSSGPSIDDHDNSGPGGGDDSFDDDDDSSGHGRGRGRGGDESLDD